MQVRTLGQEDPLEEGMATHSSILAWRIPWTEESGGPAWRIPGTGEPGGLAAVYGVAQSRTRLKRLSSSSSSSRMAQW